MELLSSSSELYFRKPWRSRISLLVLALVVAGGHPAFVTAPGIWVKMNSVSWVAFGMIEVVALPLGTLCFYLSGPEHLSLDLNRRTYRYVFGWPFWPEVHEGLWEDMAGIYIWNMNSGRFSGYGVGIAWKENMMRSRVLGMKPSLLGTFDGLGRLDRANKMASEIAATLSLPRVEPPFPVRRRA